MWSRVTGRHRSAQHLSDDLGYASASRKWRIDAILPEIHNLSNFLQRAENVGAALDGAARLANFSEKFGEPRLYAPPPVKLPKSGGTGGRLDR